MIKQVIITEICDEGPVTGSYDYDLLPENVKNVVNEAMNPKSGYMNYFSKRVNIYNDGIQYLFNIKHPMIKIGETVQYIGSVELYHDYDLQNDDEDDEDDEYKY